MKKLSMMLLLVMMLIMTCSVAAFAEETIDPDVKKPIMSSVIRKGKGKTTIKWKEVAGVSGYEIEYATKSDFSNAKKVVVAGKTTVSKTLAKDKVSTTKNTIIRMRSYKKVGDDKVYSKWSPKVKIIVWNKDWKYAKNSKIHSDPAVLYYATANSKKITVAVNAGHGTKGGASVKTLSHPDGTGKVTGGTNAKGAKTSIAVSGGTTVQGKSEASVNLTVAKKVKASLLKEGYNVLMIRQDSDIQLDNIARTVMANNNANAHIAIHFDSTTSNKGAFYIGVPDVKSYRNMAPVKSNYKKHEALGKDLISGLKSAGVKIFSSGRMAIDLTQTSYSTIASVDIEVGDRNSSISDAALTKISKGIVKGIKKNL